MATSFRGWGGAWGDSWGPTVTDPNAMFGDTTFSVNTNGTLTAVGVTSRLKYWDGSAWVGKTLKTWDGLTWQTKTLSYWNGISWI